MQGRIQFEVNGTIIQNMIRLLQYRRSVNGMSTSESMGNTYCTVEIMCNPIYCR